MVDRNHGATVLFRPNLVEDHSLLGDLLYIQDGPTKVCDLPAGLDDPSLVVGRLPRAVDHLVALHQNHLGHSPRDEGRSRQTLQCCLGEDLRCRDVVLRSPVVGHSRQNRQCCPGEGLHFRVEGRFRQNHQCCPGEDLHFRVVGRFRQNRQCCLGEGLRCRDVGRFRQNLLRCLGEGLHCLDVD